LGRSRLDEDDEDTLLEFSPPPCSTRMVQTEERIMALSTATTFFGYLTDRLPKSFWRKSEPNWPNPVFPVLEMDGARSRRPAAVTTRTGRRGSDRAGLLSRMEELSE
jgi:hypothetical protein